MLSKKIFRNISKGIPIKVVLIRQALLVRVSFVDAIDKTSVGKIDKKVLRE